MLKVRVFGNHIGRRVRVVLALVGILGLVSAASAGVQNPPSPPPLAWGTQGVPWAANAILTQGTAGVGTDLPTGQVWGPAFTVSMGSGQSFSYSGTNNSGYVAWNGPTTPANTPFSRPSYLYPSGGTTGAAATGLPASYYSGSTNTSSGSLSGYYPQGSDWNSGPTGVIQPSAGYQNQNLNSLRVATMVTSITSSSGSTIYSDPYSNGNKLNIYGPYGGVNNAGGTAAGPTGRYSPGASAAFLAGTFIPTNNTVTGVTMQWRTRSPNEMDKGTGTNNQLPSTTSYLASDVLQTSGMAAGTDYVMQMSFDNELETPGDQVYDIQNGALYLGMLYNVGGKTQWTNAVSANIQSVVSQSVYNQRTHQYTSQVANLPAVGPYAWQGSYGASNVYTGAASTTSRTPYLGSFQSFLNSTYIQGGNTHYYYEHSLDELRGTWGIDTTADTAWAVLDVGSGIFAVVPEPESIRLLAGGMLTLALGLWWRRRARIRASKLQAVVNPGKSERLPVAA